MTSRCYFGMMNSILGSVVPLAMFLDMAGLGDADSGMFLPKRKLKSDYVLTVTW